MALVWISLKRSVARDRQLAREAKDRETAEITRRWELFDLALKLAEVHERGKHSA